MSTREEAIKEAKRKMKEDPEYRKIAEEILANTSMDNLTVANMSAEDLAFLAFVAGACFATEEMFKVGQATLDDLSVLRAEFDKMIGSRFVDIQDKTAGEVNADPENTTQH